MDLSSHSLLSTLGEETLPQHDVAFLDIHLH